MKTTRGCRNLAGGAAMGTGTTHDQGFVALLIFFWLASAFAVPPENDSFANRHRIQHPSDWRYINLAESTLETNDPSTTHPGIIGNVWLEWVPDKSGEFNVDVQFGTGRSTMRIYEGSSIESLVPRTFEWVSAPDGVRLSQSSVNLQSPIVAARFIAASNVKYQIVLEHREPTGVAEGSLRIVSVIPGDDFSSRISISGDGPWQYSTDPTIGEPGEPHTYGSAITASQWFEWTAASAGRYFVHAAEPGLAIQAFQGTNLPSLHEIGSATSGFNFAGFEAAAGEKVIVAIRLGTSNRTSFLPERHRGLFQIVRAATNDYFDKRIEISLNQDVRADGRGGHLEAGEFNPFNDSNGSPNGYRWSSLWYRWKCPKTGGYTVRVLDFFSRTRFAVYTGSQVDPLTKIASTGDLPDWGVSFRAEAGVEYAIELGGPAVREILFNIQRGPDNDNIANARVLSGGRSTLTVVGTTVGASAEPGEGNGDPIQTVWYRIPDATNGYWLASVTPAESMRNLFLEIRTNNTHGTPGGRLIFAPNTVVDARPGSGVRWLGVGTRDSFGSPTDAAFTLTLVPGTPNDSLSSALPLPDDVRLFGSLRGSTRQESEPSRLAPGTSVGSVWYTWSARQPGPMVARLQSVGYASAAMTVYEGSSLETLRPVQSSIASDPGLELRTGFIPTAGRTYRIQVEGELLPNAELNASHQLVVTRTHGQDTFSGWLIGPTTTNTIPEFLATREPGEPHHGEGAEDASLWFSPHWLTRTKYLFQYTFPLSQSGIVAAYTWSNSQAPASISNLIRFPTKLRTETINETLRTKTVSMEIEQEPGRQVFVAVTGPAKDSSADGRTVTLNYVVPPNDHFDQRETIPSYPWSNNRTYGGLTIDSDETHTPGTVNGTNWWSTEYPVTGVAWFEFKPATSGRYYVGSKLARTAVYRGTNVANLELVGLTPPGRLHPVYGALALPNLGILAFDAAEGEIFQIAALSAGGTIPEDSIALGPVASNDSLARAETIQALPFVSHGSTRGSDHEPGEPAITPAPKHPSGSVWYRWTPNGTGQHVISIAGPDSPTFVVYEGSVMAELKPVPLENVGREATGRSYAEFLALAGRTYSIAIDGVVDMSPIIVPPPCGRPGCTGSVLFPDARFEMALSMAAENTRATLALPVAGNNLRISLGEPISHEPEGSTPSLWWLWAAPRDGVVELSIESPDPRIRAIFEVHDSHRANEAPKSIPLNEWHARGCKFFAIKGVGYTIRTYTYMDVPVVGFSPSPVHTTAPGTTWGLQYSDDSNVQVPADFGGTEWQGLGLNPWISNIDTNAPGGWTLSTQLDGFNIAALKANFPGPGRLRFHVLSTGSLAPEIRIRSHRPQSVIRGPSANVYGTPLLDMPLSLPLTPAWTEAEFGVPAGATNVTWSFTGRDYLTRLAIANVRFEPGAMMPPMISVRRATNRPSDELWLEIHTWRGFNTSLEYSLGMNLWFPVHLISKSQAIPGPEGNVFLYSVPSNGQQFFFRPLLY